MALLTRESESFGGRVSGTDRNPWGRDRTPNDLLRNGEFHGWVEIAKTSAKNAKNAKSREEILSAVRVK
jgi:hypothetical protein